MIQRSWDSDGLRSRRMVGMATLRLDTAITTITSDRQEMARICPRCGCPASGSQPVARDVRLEGVVSVMFRNVGH